MQFPEADARKSVGGLAFPRCEPGKNNRHAAANGLAGHEAAELAGEEQRRFALFLEVGDMRAVKVNLGGAVVGGDFEFGQAAVALEDGQAARNFEASQLLWDL